MNVKNYYLLEVLDGVYFANFKGNKDSLVYTVDQDEAWKTTEYQSAQKMILCLIKLYNVQSKIKVYGSNPSDNYKEDTLA